jgi:hypothetical protein
MNEATSNSNGWMNVTVLPGMVKGTTEIVLLTLPSIRSCLSLIGSAVGLLQGMGCTLVLTVC